MMVSMTELVVGVGIVAAICIGSRINSLPAAINSGGWAFFWGLSGIWAFGIVGAVIFGTVGAVVGLLAYGDDASQSENVRRRRRLFGQTGLRHTRHCWSCGLAAGPNFSPAFGIALHCFGNL